MRACRRCGTEQPEEDFYVKKSTGYVIPTCKRCIRAASKRYRDAHPEQTRETVRRCRLRKNYELDPAEFKALRRQQRRRCAICGVEPEYRSETDPGLLVDFDSRSRRVRGLLCRTCFRGVEKLGQRPGFLEPAVAYLGRAEGVAA